MQGDGIINGNKRHNNLVNYNNPNRNWNLCFNEALIMKIKIEDIIFWIIILAIIALAIWLLAGSPTDTSAIVALVAFVAASEILLWKALFKIDKKTTVGFMRLKNDLDKKHDELKSLIKKK